MNVNNEKEMDLVSVIIPAYNSETYLEKCIKSVREQTYKNLEIIIVNDGSSDESLIKSKKLADRDQRIIVMDKENGGVSSARNAGLVKATGKYVSFVDSDDWIEKELYSSMIKEMQKNECECGMFEYYIDYPTSTIRHEHKGFSSVITGEDAIFATISPANRFACTKIFLRELLVDLKFDESILVGEDTLFSCEVLQRAKKVYYTNTPFYHYFQNVYSATGSGYNEKFLTVVDAYKKIYGLVEGNPCLETCAKAELAMFLINNIVGIYNNYRDKYLGEAKECLQLLRSDAGRLLRHRKIPLKYKIKISLCVISPRVYSYLMRR